MQQPTRLISTPFAQEGEKTEIQNVTGEFDNSATYRLGFPPLTMQSIRLGGKPPKGTDFNGVLFDITENISFLCKGGRYQYNAGLSTLIGGYPEGSNLLLDDNVTEVVSTVAGNQNNPNINMTGWILKPNKTTAEYVLDASGETQQQVNYNGGSKWHSRVGGYQLNERVALSNGDIVKSTIDGNTNDPNVTMTGWVKTNAASQIFDESGKSQQEINSNIGFWDGGLKSYIKFITYEALGAKFDGVTDDTLAIQRGNNLTLSGYNVRAATNGGRARITSKVTFYAGVGHTDLGNCYLVPDTTVMTSGYAARIMGDINRTYNDGSKLTINLLGPYGEHGSVIPPSPTTTLRGLEINPGTNTQVSNVDLYIKVQGFYENVYIGQKSVYLLRFHSPMVGRSWYRNWTFDCVEDAGENISFFGGCSYNCRNADRTAVDMTVTTEGHFIDLYLYGVSQDYNDIDFDIKSGIVTKNGGHNENNSIKPYAKLSYKTGKRHPTLNLIGVYFDGGNDWAQDAGNKGKPILFDVGAGTSIVIKGGTIGKYGKMQGVKIFGGLENAAHLVKMSDVYFDIQNDVDMIDWGINNPLRNRDYSLGNINFWQNTSTASGTPNTPTVTVESSPFGGVGMRVNCATNTGDTTTNIVQRLPCKSGELIYMFAKLGWKNINAIDGHGYAQCIFYDAFGNELERSSVGTNLAGKSGDSSEWINCSRIVRVPSGAYFVDVGLRHYQISGDVWFGPLNVFIQ